MNTPATMSEQIERIRPALEDRVKLYSIIEELVKREFGAHADPALNIARAQAVMTAYALEQHAVYTQRVAYVALPLDGPAPPSNGSTGKPS